MKHKIAICVGLIALAVASSAQAQVYPPGRVYSAPPYYGDGLPPREILALVRAQGLRPLTQPARRGPARYVLLASDHVGGQFHVVVNAFDGRVVRVIPTHDPRFAYHPARPPGMIPNPPPQHGAAPPERELPPAVRGPRTGSAPAPADTPRVASTPDGASAAPPSRPARTPLPRPRPATASNEAQPPTESQASVATEAQPAQPSAARPAAPKAAPSAPVQMVPVAPLD